MIKMMVINSGSRSGCPLRRLLDKIDIKDPPLEGRPRVFGYDRYNELRYCSCKQPGCAAPRVSYFSRAGNHTLTANLLQYPGNGVRITLGGMGDDNEYFSR